MKKIFKKTKYILGIIFGYIFAGINNIFGQWNPGQGDTPQPDDWGHMVVGLPYDYGRELDSYRQIPFGILALGASIITACIGIYIFLRKAAKKDPPMSKTKKILISIAIFLGTFVITRFLISLIWRRISMPCGGCILY